MKGFNLRYYGKDVILGADNLQLSDGNITGLGNDIDVSRGCSFT